MELLLILRMKRIWLIFGVLVFTKYTPGHAGMTVYATDGLTRVGPDDAPQTVASSVLIRAANENY